MEMLYYYTTAETMKSILTKGDIFATHISYLNDSEEYINGLRELREVFWGSSMGTGAERERTGILDQSIYEESLKEVPQIYSISFSREDDLLSQWYMYAKESGVRLGLSFPDKKQQFLIKKMHTEKEIAKKVVESTLRDVHYFTRIGMSIEEYQNEKKEINEAIQKYAEDIGIQKGDDANYIRLWKEIAPYIKNYEFRQEREVRLVFNAVVDSENIKNKSQLDLIEYRNAKGVLIPYIDVYKEEGWPVVEIMVGPGRNQNRVFNSICHFVDYSILKIPEIDQKQNMRSFIKGLASYQVEQNIIEDYCKKIEETVVNGQGILTYKGQIYDILKHEDSQKNKDSHEREYLDRNYYSNCGIIVRKSNAPYEFS